MSEPLDPDRLMSLLRAEGLTVVEYQDWRSNSRNHKGEWGPVHGVMIHHTVTEGTEPTVSLCYRGHSNLPGPLCHGVISKSGIVYLVGTGRTNHAGLGDADVLQAVIHERPLPPDHEANSDGNAHFYGFECENLGDGKDPWPVEQVDAIVRASAAICRAYGWSARSTIGHLEWQPGKVDPRPSPGGADVSMDALRTRIDQRLTEERENMPRRIVLETKDFPQTVLPHDWTQLRFNREFNDDDNSWADREKWSTLLVGAAYYSLTIAVEVDGLTAGQEFQIRFVHNKKNAQGEWVRDDNLPISSPVHQDLKGKFIHVWNSFVPGYSSNRVCAEVFHMGENPVTINFARVEGLIWRD